MSSLQSVEADLRDALKRGDKEILSTLRMLVTELRNEEMRTATGTPLDEATFVRVVQRAIKQRREAAEQFRAGDRLELAEKEDREAVILARYLPQQASEEELRAAVEQLVAEQGLAGPAAVGAAMKATMARFAGRAEGATVNRIVRDVLARG